MRDMEDDIWTQHLMGLLLM
uniref:Uncharacterized protein n=1 Tax=Anguilla anguilla TaxID=7936 RepID=A0A0E9UTU2_ANGAN